MSAIQRMGLYREELLITAVFGISLL